MTDTLGRVGSLGGLFICEDNYYYIFYWGLSLFYWVWLNGQRALAFSFLYIKLKFCAA